MWSGAIVDIPAGWHICDGNDGTINLLDKFIIGAGATFNPAATGGASEHNHDFTADNHNHSFFGGVGIDSGVILDLVTTDAAATGTTDNASSLPPFFALAFIQKI